MMIRWDCVRRPPPQASAHVSGDSVSSPSQPGRDAATVGAAPHGVARSLSRLDRFLPAWIGLAMAAGLLLGRWVPGISDALNAIKVGSVSLPIALGLLVMM